MKESEKEEHLC